MAPLAEAAERIDGERYVPGGDGRLLDPQVPQQRLQDVQAVLPAARQDHHRRLDGRRRGDHPDGGRLDAGQERLPLGLALQDGEERRGVDYHQAGTIRQAGHARRTR